MQLTSCKAHAEEYPDPGIESLMEPAMGIQEYRCGECEADWKMSDIKMDKAALYSWFEVPTIKVSRVLKAKFTPAGSCELSTS